jgi:anaerobic selenocysteine-containing dehydrogenase
MANERESTSSDPDSAGTFTRRGLIRHIGTAIAAGGAAATVGCSKTAEPLKTTGAQKITTVCPFCGVGCGQNVFTKGDKILHVEGDPQHPISEGTLCSKGAALSQVSDNPHRLRKVLYRAPGGSAYEERSWDWAIERIAQRVKQTRDATFQTTVGDRRVHRTEAIACLGGAALDNEECYLLVKAMRMLGVTYVEHQARI